MRSLLLMLLVVSVQIHAQDFDEMWADLDSPQIDQDWIDGSGPVELDDPWRDVADPRESALIEAHQERYTRLLGEIEDLEAQSIAQAESHRILGRREGWALSEGRSTDDIEALRDRLTGRSDAVESAIAHRRLRLDRSYRFLRSRGVLSLAGAAAAGLALQLLPDTATAETFSEGYQPITGATAE